uniref:Putative secreted protein n=1 Tax=Amblyomma triste TaxID=251400 RepID=A0A023FZU2_AMBTT
MCLELTLALQSAVSLSAAMNFMALERPTWGSTHAEEQLLPNESDAPTIYSFVDAFTLKAMSSLTKCLVKNVNVIAGPWDF